jgi:hypothetical protein
MNAAILANVTSLRTGQAADVMGITQRHVWRLIARNQLETQGVGHFRRVTCDSIRRYLGVSSGEKELLTGTDLN